MQNIDYISLAYGAFMSVATIYALLGLFSSAPWLHTDGRRKSGQWVPSPTPRSVRAFFFFYCLTQVVRGFADAFHRDSSRFHLTIDALLLAGFLILFFINRKSKRDHEPAA